MKKLILLALPFYLVVGCAVSQGPDPGPTASRPSVTSEAALWQPGMHTMRTIRETCGRLSGEKFSECFIENMKKNGASEKALAFTRFIGEPGFMRDFRETGPVDIAYAYSPFRGNENQRCFLVNGRPDLIDVDDLTLWPKHAMEKDPAYAALKKRYPAIALWPGDRSGTDFIAMERSPDGRRFIVNYELTAGCHACEPVGAANFAFHFDNRGGTFLGSEFLGLADRIETGAGREFTIELRANWTTGYQWQLRWPRDESFIKAVRREYIRPESGQPRVGAGGKEVWTFKAVKPATTLLSFKYTRPWEKNAVPAKITNALLVVDERDK